jgi:5,10-methylenetetrahydrofolate reductase
MERAGDLGLPERAFILIGVGPLRSAKAAEWMRTHVPGVHIPDEIVRRDRRAQTTRRAKAGASASISSARSGRSRASPACT